jgi:hypothetical protein
VDEALLQRMREESGLRLDRQGRFLHRGEPVEHQRTAQVLHRGLHRADDGRWATRIGREWAYVEVEDAARFVRRAEAAPERPGWLRLWLLGREDDDAPLLLDAAEPAAGLAAAADGALLVRLPDGERALLLRTAQLALQELLHEGPNGFTLDLAGRRVPIGADRGPEPVRRPR